MESALETHTLALSFDLAEEFVTGSSSIVWNEVITSHAFYKGLANKVAMAIQREFGANTRPLGEMPLDTIQNTARATASSYITNDSAAAIRFKRFYETNLKLKAKEIENHFKLSKTGMWIDENKKSLIVIVSVLTTAAGYGLYSFRHTQAAIGLVDLANYIGVKAAKKIHIGTVQLSGEISNFSLTENTLQMKGGMTKKWKLVSLKADSSGIIDFRTGRLTSGNAQVSAVIPIDQKLSVRAGLKSRTRVKQPEEHAAFMSIDFISGPKKIQLECNIVEGSRNDKSCAAKFSVNY
ncbi:hypothetical protein [Litoribacillus peritrichatus]|uniref:Uncharacterized protein n=1 Tax=Litoribacillus peritrichatus TaxID=718191 RepID=A0ABP7MY14_9GAMM